MFQLKDKVTGNIFQIYSVRSVENKTEFLVYIDDYGFSWTDSSYYEPLFPNLEKLNKKAMKESMEFKRKSWERD
jgi:hypothetical protein